MHPVTEFFRKLFSTEGFPARWHCGRWTDFHGWMYIIGDLLIWSAYFAIPLIIVMYVSRRRNSGIRFQRIYLLFASFILACGSTHLIDAVIFWYPVYRFSALVRVATGIVSWVTIFHLVKTLPTALSLKSPAALEAEVMHRRAAEAELVEKNAMLAAAQSIAKLGYWRWDISSGAIQWSDEMFRIWDIPAGTTITYETFMNRIHPADREMMHNLIQTAAQTGQYETTHHRMVLPSGDVKHMLARGEAVRDETTGAIIGLSGTVQDVTAQRTAELQLIARTQQLQRTNAELEAFAYVASHDLQEPLRKVRTFADLLGSELNGNTTEDANHYLQKITSSAGRMQLLIHDILQFSRLTHREDFTEVNLNTTVQQVIADADLRIAETGARIEVEMLCSIEAIPAQMNQLFTNLVGNALKYVKPGTSPHIRIAGHTVAGNELTETERRALGYAAATFSPADWAAARFCHISIEDNGIGFEPEYAEKIFTIFQRLHARDAYEGTGIGLAVCRKIAEVHHGFIAATGRPGEGATFTVTLPLSQVLFRDEVSEEAGAALADA
jgi:signal transduction histidine kinase